MILSDFIAADNIVRLLRYPTYYERLNFDMKWFRYFWL